LLVWRISFVSVIENGDSKGEDDALNGRGSIESGQSADMRVRIHVMLPIRQWRQFFFVGQFTWSFI
jgi:hypothetical protein